MSYNRNSRKPTSLTFLQSIWLIILDAVQNVKVITQFQVYEAPENEKFGFLTRFCITRLPRFSTKVIIIFNIVASFSYYLYY